ncbi:MAG: hypothetical protein C4540_04145 [Candidatus Omnitrophota bacterium]|jgi:hypothetical protein|nr:MAG: hypothetical protein C4540_04145 [Candidatus Omnitrophota bacterium]
MKKKLTRFLPWIVVWSAAILTVTTFGKPYVLKTYVEMGIGTCNKIPVLCILPSQNFTNPQIDKNYILSLARYKIEEIEIALPKDFFVIKEQIYRAYYKKRKRTEKDSIAYLLYQNPDFFQSLFPQLKKYSLKNNYDFLSRILNARTPDIKDLPSTLFVILKSIFTPDIGPGSNIKIARFSVADKRGFITYNYTKEGNYFNCDIVNSKQEFFKVYLKDKKKELDIDKVLTIISTLQKNKEKGQG